MPASKSTKSPAPSKPRTTAAASMGGVKVLNETGAPVDWWFMYKVSKDSKPADSMKGVEYLYYDADGASAKAPVKKSANTLDQQQGAMFQTLSQLYASAKAPNSAIGWFFYNDENPEDKSGYKNPVNGATYPSPKTYGPPIGHTKGVFAFDTASGTGFWLVQSTPRFPWPANYNYPASGMIEAQTYLCVSIPDAATTLSIATQIYNCQQPNVYAASPLPKSLANSPTDPRVLLMNNKIAKPTAFVKSVIPFVSPGGQKFQAIAKNEQWGQKPVLDFYNDLVGQVLNEDLDVETWEDGLTTPLPQDHNSNHKVIGMHAVDLTKLGYPISWSESNDHAKLAISDPDESVHWVCVGDINFTDSMEKRSGGTLAFQCDPLWQALQSILMTAILPGGKTKVLKKSSAPTAKPTVPAKPVVKKPTAKKSAPIKKANTKKGTAKPKAAAKKITPKRSRA